MFWMEAQLLAVSRMGAGNLASSGLPVLEPKITILVSILEFTQISI